MSVYKIKENIYSVGVMNPSLRVFDIIMKTEYGTSYNAYLVKDEKTVLIDTVHESFFDEYLENIETLCNVKDIDYLILNHTEPDHTGSVRRLLEINPNIQVIATIPGSKYIAGITNEKLEIKVVKDGETLNIGNKELKFIVAPFLHWPDSMFTYIEQDKIIFTCDFLGSHYCQPRLFDKHILYKDAYDASFEYYYAAIFSPFKEHVLVGLNKIKDLEFDVVCPSHGPVLVDNIEECILKYRNWSKPKEASGTKKVVILYVSAYGYTRMLAETAFNVLKEKGFDVEIKNVIEHNLGCLAEDIENADAIMLGSPTINRDALMPIWSVTSVIDAIKNKGKPCAIFGSFGWSGEAVGMLTERIKGLKLKVYGDGFKANFKPSEQDIECMQEFTEGFISSM